jgi:rRNA-processing protein FCF1
MSIEQKIAEMLAESRAKDTAVIEESNKVVADAAAGDQAVIKPAGSVSAPPGGGGSGKEAAGDQSVIRPSGSVPNGGETPNPDNAKNAVTDEDEAENAGPGKTSNAANAKEEKGDQKVVRKGNAVSAAVKEDVDALVNGEDLSEEFKAKAATIFEAAITSRVKDEIARLEEEFDAKLEEATAKNQEGLVEKVDGYLDYVVEQWIKENEIALESGMKSEILEGFVSGLKGLFEEHYIDIPEEKFDVLGAQEEAIAELEAKLDEQVAANVELNKVINEATRDEVIASAANGLAETDKEKFLALAEELSYEDAETFSSKIQTIRENYFTNKASTIVESVVTDSPVESLNEDKKPSINDPKMKNYMSVLNNLK